MHCLKRVRRFERPTFTLATCKSTELTQSITPISSDFEKGITETVTSSEHDEQVGYIDDAVAVYDGGVSTLCIYEISSKFTAFQPALHAGDVRAVHFYSGTTGSLVNRDSSKFKLL